MARLIDHLEKLPAFLAVAECGSFRRAAAQVHLAQPSVSRSIALLEEALGVALFERRARGVTLTSAGKQLLSLAQGLSAQVEDTESRLRAPQNPFAGKIRIGTFDSLIGYLWIPLLPKLQRTFPELNVTLASVRSPSAHEQLLSGALDLIVDVEPPRLPGVVSEVLYTDRFCFYAARGGRVPPVTRNLIYVPEAIDGERVTLRERLSGRVSFDRQYELDTFEAAKAMAVARLGIAVLPRRLATREVARGALTSLALGPFSKRGFGSHRITASLRGSDPASGRTAALVRFLRSHLQREATMPQATS